jgi:rhodanese-related sulfurtransferase
METLAITQLLKDTKTKNIAVVDVRTHQEREQIFIPNTLHIPVDELESRIQEIKSYDKVYFFCKAGRRAEFASQTAKNHGINSIALLDSIFEIHSASQGII